MLDRVRRRVNEARFALGAQIVLARSDPIEVAEGYARVAEAAVVVLADAAVAEFEKAHGQVPGSELLILGLGRLGGGALTHASDLDLVYLFSGTPRGRIGRAASRCARPIISIGWRRGLPPRSASRPRPARSTKSIRGFGPSGADGLLAISLPSFADYQREPCLDVRAYGAHPRPAGLWFGGGPGSARARRRRAAAHRARSGKVAADAARMRAEVALHKPPRGRFDIKLGPGGLVDLEFAVQTLQLTHRIGLTPYFDDAIAELVEAGLVPAEIADPPPAHADAGDASAWSRPIGRAARRRPGRSSRAPAALADWDALLAAHERRGRAFPRSVAQLSSAWPRENEMLSEGDRVPDVKLIAMDGAAISPADFRGNKLVLYFYPKDDTTGCTREAQDFSRWPTNSRRREPGSSASRRTTLQSTAKFTDKYGLSVRLASDTDGSVCEAFGTWIEKSLVWPQIYGD